jgi:D-glycerate 3-kinase
MAAATARLLHAEGLSAVALSLDDFYLGRAERETLARTVHPLLAVRGPPGTHRVEEACLVLDSLRRAGTTRLFAFDKSRDERCPAGREVQGPVDVVLFEGWCIGARPEPEGRLGTAVNDLERDQDPDGVWRRYVNGQLADRYPALFGRLDGLVLLAAPGFEVVQAWRTEQEHKLRARTGRGMSDAEVARFVQHYERITRWILEEMPARADWTVRLAEDRTPAA